MSALGAALGGEHCVSWKGKTYKCSLVTQDVKLAYERRLFQQARDLAREMRDVMTQEEFAAHLKQLSDDYLAGEYALLSPRGLKSLQTTQGILRLCALLFGCDENEIIGLVADQTAEVTELLRVIITESFPLPDQAPAPTNGEDAKKKGLPSFA